MAEQDTMEVYCRTFRKEISCRKTGDGYRYDGLGDVPENVKDICCFDTHTALPYGNKQQMQCCEALEENLGNLSGWDSGSYQAYVMGVAVVAILLCLFISGARSVRKRRMMILRERQRRAVENVEAAHSNAVNSDLPSYGELEACGLMKNLKSELTPPSYPIVQNQADNLTLAPVPREDDQTGTGPTDSTESMEPPPYTPR